MKLVLARIRYSRSRGNLHVIGNGFPDATCFSPY